MKKKLLIIAIIFLANIVSAQIDTLNQYNENGRRNGYWTQYLDEKLNPTDSVEAYFTGIELWDNGKQVFRFYPKGEFEKYEYSYSFSEIPTFIDHTILLEGTFVWKDTLGNELNKEIYKNGRPVFFEITKPSKKSASVFYQTFDWTRKYKNIEGSYYYEERNVIALSDIELVKKYCFRKKGRKWKVRRVRN